MACVVLDELSPDAAVVAFDDVGLEILTVTGNSAIPEGKDEL